MFLGEFSFPMQHFGSDALGAEDPDEVLLSKLWASIRCRMMATSRASGTGKCFASKSSIKTASSSISFSSARVTDFLAVSSSNLRMLGLILPFVANDLRPGFRKQSGIIGGECVHFFHLPRLYSVCVRSDNP